MTGGSALETLTGGSGDDDFYLGSNLTAADKIAGGAGNDTVFLDGGYEAGLTLGAGELQSIETVSLATGSSYNLTLGGGDVAAGQTLTIDGSALNPSSDFLTVNGSAETTGSLVLIGSGNNDILTGGAGNDTFVSNGGSDTITGGGGNDTVVLSGNSSDYLYFSVSPSSAFIFGLVDGSAVTQTTNVAYAQFADQTVQIGALSLTGTAGDDSLFGGNGNDVINFSQGGDDLVNAAGTAMTRLSPARR